MYIISSVSETSGIHRSLALSRSPHHQRPTIPQRNKHTQAEYPIICYTSSWPETTLLNGLSEPGTYITEVTFRFFTLDTLSNKCLKNIKYWPKSTNKSKDPQFSRTNKCMRCMLGNSTKDVLINSFKNMNCIAGSKLKHLCDGCIWNKVKHVSVRLYSQLALVTNKQNITFGC